MCARQQALNFVSALAPQHHVLDGDRLEPCGRQRLAHVALRVGVAAGRIEVVVRHAVCRAFNREDDAAARTERAGGAGQGVFKRAEVTQGVGRDDQVELNECLANDRCKQRLQQRDQGYYENRKRNGLGQ